MWVKSAHKSYFELSVGEKQRKWENTAKNIFQPISIAKFENHIKKRIKDKF